MDIAAYLHPNLLSHLVTVAGAKHRILGAESWEDLGRKIRAQPIDLAVLDPMADGRIRVTQIQGILDEFPSVPAILYAQLSADTLQATVDLARAGVRHVVLYRYDDNEKRFLELIESQPGAALAQMLLERLDEPLSRLAPALRRTVERMFGAPGHFQAVPDLATAAKLSKRTLYREFEAANLASPRSFVSAARLLRAYAYMLEPGSSVEIAARKLGYETNAFRRLVRSYFNTTPQVVRRGIGPVDFVALLADILYPTPMGDSGSA